jgi:hypothetical protein
MSRLDKIKTKHLLQQTGFLVAITIFIIVGFFVFGIPLLIKLAVNIGDQKSQSKFQVVDSQAPNPPTIDFVPTATNSGDILISGYSEPNAIITLVDSGLSLGNTIVNNDGIFQLPISNLAEGLHQLTITATDTNQNQSLAAPVITINIDQTAPDITINHPEPDAIITGIYKQFITIEGTVSEPVKLTMNDTFLVVTNDNTFSTKIYLNDGENVFNFIATDLAGNQSNQELKVSYFK